MAASQYLRDVPRQEVKGSYIWVRFFVPEYNFQDDAGYDYKLTFVLLSDTDETETLTGTAVQVSTGQSTTIGMIEFRGSVPADKTGVYGWRFSVVGKTDSTKVQTAETGQITIQEIHVENSFANESLEMVEKIIEQKLENRSDVTSYMIGGRNIVTMSLDELFKFRNRLRQEVYRRENRLFRKFKRGRVV